MRIIIFLSLIFSSFFLVSEVHAEDSFSLRVCEYILVDDKRRMRSFLKNRKLKFRSIFDTLACDQKNLLVYAAKSHALDVGELIINKMSVKIVRENINEITIYSPHLGKIAKERIQ